MDSTACSWGWNVSVNGILSWFSSCDVFMLTAINLLGAMMARSNNGSNIVTFVEESAISSSSLSAVAEDLKGGLWSVTIARFSQPWLNSAKASPWIAAYRKLARVIPHPRSSSPKHRRATAKLLTEEVISTMPGHVMGEADTPLYVGDVYHLADSFDDGFLAFLSRFLEFKGPLEIAAGIEKRL